MCGKVCLLVIIGRGVKHGSSGLIIDLFSFFLEEMIFYISTILLTFYGFLHISWRLWKRKYSFLPHAPNVPWLGSLPYLGTSVRDFTQRVDEFSKTYNHFYVLWIGPIPVVRVARPALVEAVLKSPGVNEKSVFYSALVPFIGNGLLLSTGSKWKQRRTVITPAFHFSILKDFSEVFADHAQELVDVFKKSSDAVEVQHLLTLSTLDTICASSMGVELNALRSSADCEYVTNLERFKDLSMLRSLNPLAMMSDSYYNLTANGKASQKALNALHKFTVDVINERIQKRKESLAGASGGGNGGVAGKKRRVLIDTLLDLYEQGEIDVDGIQEEIDTFMFAGKNHTN